MILFCNTLVATSNSSSQWESGQTTNKQFQMQMSLRPGEDISGGNLQISHTSNSNSNGNSIQPLRRTFQQNTSSDHSNNSQINVPNYSNNPTSNLNLNVLPGKVMIKENYMI